MLDLHYGALLGVPEMFPKVIATMDVVDNDFSIK